MYILENYGLGPLAFKHTRKDALSLLAGVAIERTPRKVQRWSLSTVDDVLKHVLSPDMVQLLAWGELKVKLADGSTKRLPAAIRNHPVSMMYKNYNDSRDGSEDRAMGRTAYYTVVGLVTKGSRSARSAVDYVSNALVDDNGDRLRTIIDIVFGKADEAERRSALSHRLDLVLRFLKVLVFFCLFFFYFIYKSH